VLFEEVVHQCDVLVKPLVDGFALYGRIDPACSILCITADAWHALPLVCGADPDEHAILLRCQ